MSEEIDKRAKRARLVNEAREVFSRHETEKRDITADEQTQFDGIMTEVDKLKEEIDNEARYVALAKAEQELEEVRSKAPKLEVENSEYRKTDIRETDEYREAFRTYCKRNDLAEIRALTGGATTGATLLPTVLETQIIKKIGESSVMRGLATVVSYDSDRTIPTVTAFGSAAWTGAGVAYNESDDAFSEVSLSAHKMTRIIKVSEELLQDNVINLEAHLADSFARSFVDLSEAAYFKGTGTGQPTGITPSADLGYVLPTSGVFTAEDFVQSFHALDPVYRDRASWILNDTGIQQLRALREGTGDAAGGATRGNFIWQPGLQAGQPDTVLGRPVFVSSNVDGFPASAGADVALFGDMSAYVIADRVGISFQRLNERYADTGFVGFRAAMRTDGVLTVTGAVRRTVNP